MFSLSLAALVLSLIFPLIFRRNLEDKCGHPIPPGPPFRYPFLRHRPERALHQEKIHLLENGFKVLKMAF
jgi:hypothetical protein